jgi:hypothetical protein
MPITINRITLEPEETVQEANKVLHQTVKDIMRNQDFEGNTPTFSVAFCDTFTDTNFDPDDRGELQ